MASRKRELNIEIAGKNLHLTLDGDAGETEIIIGKKRYFAEILSRTPENVILRLNGKVYDLLIAANGDVQVVTVAGNVYEARVEDARIARLKALAGGEAGSSAQRELRAPMPGLVLDILVGEGQAVNRNDGLLIIEAMKMENELRAAGPATISKIHVVEGQPVEKGALLLSFA